MNPIEYSLVLSTGETIEIAEIDLDFVLDKSENVMSGAAPILALCGHVTRAIMEESKSGYDANLKLLLRDPWRAMMKLSDPVCSEIKSCAMANEKECTTRYNNGKKGKFPICFSYNPNQISYGAKMLCDTIIQLWRRGLYVVIVH